MSPGTVSAYLKIPSTSPELLRGKPLSLPSAPHPDVVAVETETSVDIRKDTLSYPFADTTLLDIPTDDHECIGALLKKHSYKVCFSVEMHHSSLHPVDSTFDTGTIWNVVHRSFLRPSWRTHI